MTHSHCRGKCIIETHLLEGLLGPISHVLEIGRVVGTGETDVVGEQNCADSVLVSVNCIGSEEKLNFIFGIGLSSDSDSDVLEPI